jgi:hypothetical protein
VLVLVLVWVWWWAVWRVVSSHASNRAQARRMGVLEGDFGGQPPKQSQPGRVARGFLDKYPSSFTDATLDEVRNILEELAEFRWVVARWRCVRADALAEQPPFGQETTWRDQIILLLGRICGAVRACDVLLILLVLLVLLMLLGPPRASASAARASLKCLCSFCDTAINRQKMRPADDDDEDGMDDSDEAGNVGGGGGGGGDDDDDDEYDDDSDDGDRGGGGAHGDEAEV